MNLIIRIFGLPHEALHLLGLLLIGRRAVRWTRTQVEIPGDLSIRDYVIVAGLPALVFGLITVIGVYLLLNASSYDRAILAFIVIFVGGLAFAGTSGDLQLITKRMENSNRPQP